MDKTADKKSKKKKAFKMPHTYIILGIIIVIAMVLTWVIPAGQFDRQEDAATGRTIVVPDSYHRVDRTPVNPFQMFVSLQEGMINAADIIFFIFFAYGFVYMQMKTGAFDGAVGALLRKMGGKEKYLIPVFMILFGLCGASFGMYEETFGLIPAFVGIAIALGYDGLVGGAMVVVGVATGFASAMFNPFTIGVAQTIAELPLFSGWQYRVIIFICFMSLSIWYVMRYAAKVKENPDYSFVKDVKFSMEDKDKDAIANAPFTGQHKISMILFLITIILIIFGTLKLGWYINEIAALFIIMTIVVGLIGKLTLSQIAETFVEAVGNAVFGALVVGIARSILIVMQQGNIIDTIVYGLSKVVANASGFVSGVLMLAVQNLLNFIIPSGSGQAATSMPIMTPLADMIGVTRQTAVLAFQFGDGFSNMFWPTAAATLCGMMGVPLDRWYKFMGKLFLMMFILQVVFILIAVGIGFGPF